MTVEVAPIGGIVIVLYALSEILKHTAFKNNSDMKAVLPYICAIVGAAVAGTMFAIDPTIIGTPSLMTALLSGGVSGLIATGAHQAYKQFYNIVAVADSYKASTDKKVSKMTDEEKRQFMSQELSRFTKEYFEELTKPNEEQGIDFDEEDDTASSSES